MRGSRRLRLLTLALAVGALASGGSAAVPTRTKTPTLASPRGILPGYGGPVSDQATGALAPVPLFENYELEAASGNGRPAAPKRIVGSFMVSLAPGQDPHEVAPLIARQYGGEAALIYDKSDSGFLFRGPDEARERLPSDPRVRSVQPDYVMYTAETSASVHLAAINQPTAHNAGHRGQGVRVAVLDTGADFSHTDYKSNLDLNLSRGFSYNSTTKKCSTGSDYTSAKDLNGHGGRTMSNALGLIGVARDAIGVALKVFTGSSASTSFSLIKCGVDYLVGLNSDGTTSNDIPVANASIAGSASAGTCIDGGLRQSVCALVNGVAGTTTRTAFFVAAGNSGSSASGYAPGNYPESITVSGFDCDSISCTTTKPKLASWSNRGSAVDLGAPGVAIYSARTGGGHETASGTSRAAPMGAGAAASMLSQFPGLGPPDIRIALQKGGKCPNSNPGGTSPNCPSGTWTSDDSVPEPFLNVGGAIGAAGPVKTPVGSFAAPANGALVVGNVLFQVSASDDNTAPADLHVTLEVGSRGPFAPTFNSSNGKWEYTWNSASTTDGLPDGTHTAEATITDDDTDPAPRSTTTTRTITVDNVDEKPTATFTSPINGATVAPSFTANVRAQDDRDTPTAELSVDDGPFTPMTCGTGAKTVTCTANLSLEPGGHKLEAQARDTVQTSAALAVISVTVSSAPVDWTRVEQNESSGVTYTGTWSKVSTSCGSGGWYRTSSSAGATANLAFSGRGVRFITALGPNRGHVEAWVDDDPPQTITTYDTSQTCQFQLFEWSLTPGDHTIHIRVKGTKDAASSSTTIVVDAFEYAL